MAEAARAESDRLRQERLAALGIEVLTLRTRVDAPSASVPASTGGVASARLVLNGARQAFDGGEGAALLAAILATLGLRREEISLDAIDGVPALAFGMDGAAGVTRIATLPQLREPHEKRAAWPALRRLRRELRNTPSHP